MNSQNTPIFIDHEQKTWELSIGWRDQQLQLPLFDTNNSLKTRIPSGSSEKKDELVRSQFLIIVFSSDRIRDMKSMNAVDRRISRP